MITTISEAFVALSRWVELSILGKATLMLVVGLTVVKLAGRARASMRHLLLAATLATILVLPLIALTVPELRIDVPVAQLREPISSAVPMAPSVAPSAVASGSASGTVVQSPVSPNLSWITIFRLLWSVGAILLLIPLAVNLRRLGRMRRNGLPWTEQNELMQSKRAESGIRRPVELLLHEGILAPVTCGYRRPAILLPYEACDWSSEDLRRAIIHELEHVRRGDWIIQLAARVTCAVYWFHPLVWVAFRWLSLQAERACDDAVVRSAERTEYADQLVMLAQRLSNSDSDFALGMANRSDLSKRVSALLDGSQRRGRAGQLAVAGALSTAILCLVVIAPVRAVTRSTKTGNPSAQATERKTSVQQRIATALDRALLEASEAGDIESIDELLRSGANVNAAIDGDGSPLIVAAREGQFDVVRLLLDRGADPNLAVSGDGNALIMAAGGGFASVVSLLLDRGAIIDHVVPGDENALMKASGNGHLEVVKLLVARGADVNARSWESKELDIQVTNVRKLFDRTKLTEQLVVMAMKEGGTESVIHKSTDAGATWTRFRTGLRTAEDAEVKEGEWRTPLSMARRGGHDEVVKFLISAGARE